MAADGGRRLCASLYWKRSTHLIKAEARGPRIARACLRIDATTSLHQKKFRVRERVGKAPQLVLS
jgi:hypothetical protein